MIEILREGPGLRQVTCSNCQSLLQYDERFDTKEKEEFKKIIEYIVCPVCKTKTVVRWRKK